VQLIESTVHVQLTNRLRRLSIRSLRNLSIISKTSISLSYPPPLLHSLPSSPFPTPPFPGFPSILLRHCNPDRKQSWSMRNKLVDEKPNDPYFYVMILRFASSFITLVFFCFFFFTVYYYNFWRITCSYRVYCSGSDGQHTLITFLYYLFIDFLIS